MGQAAGSGGTSGALRGQRWLRVGAVVLAGVLQAIVLVPFTVSSGLLAPLPAVVGLHLLWAAAVVVLVVTARRRPLAAPLVPLGNAFLWWVTLTAGDLLLGWTA